MRGKPLLAKLAESSNCLDIPLFKFLNTGGFWRDCQRMVADGVEFAREPQEQDYGTVAVFKDLYGNLWDLLQLNDEHPIAHRLAYRESGLEVNP